MSLPVLHVACLCAAWCQLCDAYAPVLGAVIREFAADAPGLTMHWIDIEDEAELVGDLDVETFPTIVVVEVGEGGERIRFAGALTPQPETLRRLLRAVIEDPAMVPSAMTPEMKGFARRLRMHVMDSYRPS
jgi:thiol-disulfide isomerase/thioredoxin